ncbi:MAG TPA: divalent metal cation transporter, partial [Solirubrobacteraceae bacterium]|nr:divalent metal cation transporter [Solirubrobacteraceae bacterium]
VLLNASLIGAAAVTLATSYAFGDVFGAKHSLNRGPLDAKLFYGSFALMVLAAAGIVLIPNAPLGLITTSVQALAGVLLPSATVFLLLLCNDREVLGPWRNPPWLNAIASVIIGVLVELSLILMASTIFPKLNVVHLFTYLSLGLVAILAGMGIYVLRTRTTAGAIALEPVSRERRTTWTMPPLALLERPVWSPGRRAAMLVLRGYLLIAVVLLVIKTFQLGH